MLMIGIIIFPIQIIIPKKKKYPIKTSQNKMNIFFLLSKGVRSSLNREEKIAKKKKDSH